MRKKKWYEHCPEWIRGEDDVKLIWDMNIHCDNVIEGRRPHLVLVDKKKKSCVIIDIAVPGDRRIYEKEMEKIEKYENLKRELKRFWSLRTVVILPAIVGALGCISKGFSGWLDTLGINFFSLSVYNLQTTKYRATPQGAWKYIATLWRLRITSEPELAKELDCLIS